MLHRLERLGRQLGEALAEGWRELKALSSSALTRFTRRQSAHAIEGELIPAGAPSWSILAGDVVDTGREIVVRLELPGVGKRDCEVLVRGDVLYVRGEKRFDSSYVRGDYHVRQCAYGSFERALALPGKVDAERAQVVLRNGVLTVRLPKLAGAGPKRLRVV